MLFASKLCIALLATSMSVYAQSRSSISNRSKWTQTNSVSPLDDSKTVMLSLRAENSIQGWLKTSVPSLVIRCKEGRTDVYVVTGLPANPVVGDGFPVRLRVDSKEAVQHTWFESTSKDSLVAPFAIPMARMIAESKTLLFEFTPYNASPALVRFDVTGLDKFLPSVTAACAKEWTTYEQVERDIELRKKLGPLPLGIALDVGLVRVPAPRGSQIQQTQTDTTDVVTFFIVAKWSDMERFFRGAMEMYGWTLVPVGNLCWTTETAGTAVKACIDQPRENFLRMTITPRQSK